MEQLSAHWTCLHEILYVCIFPKTVDGIKLSLNMTIMRDTLHEGVFTFTAISMSSS